MPGWSDTYENLLLNFLRGQSVAQPSLLYLSLHTADPGETGTSEVSGGSYARQAVTFGAPTSGVMTNSGSVTFSGMPSAMVTHLGVWDDSSQFVFSGELIISKSVGAGGEVQFPTGGITVTLT